MVNHLPERPTHELAVVLLRQQRTGLRQELSRVADAFRSPKHGTPRADDAAWMAAQPTGRPEALEGILGVAADNVVEVLRVADEHAAGLQVLLEAEDILPNPSTALTRSIHEALLTVCWCADPSLSSEQRITRYAVFTLGSVQDNHRAVVQLPGPPPKTVDDVVAGMVGMQDFLQLHGFVLDFNQSRPPYVHTISYGAARTSVKINMTDASARYMPETDYMWSVGSGATHSRNWFTAGLAGSRGQLAIMATAPVLDYCDALVDALDGYVGLDPAEFHRRGHVRRRALLARADDWDRTAPATGYADYAKQTPAPEVSDEP